MIGALKQITGESLAKFFLCLGLYLLCLATFGGNAMIAAGHVFLILGIANQLRNNLSGPTKRKFIPSGKISASSCLLLGYVAVCAIGIAVRWSSYDNGLDTLKKLRYETIILALLWVPGCLVYFRSERFTKFAFICLAASCFVICVAAVISYFTQVHPITGKPVIHNRIGGVSGTVMSFAYSLQFVFLPLLALFICNQEQRKWFDRLWPSSRVQRVVVFALLFTVSITFYLAGSRGAIAGAAFGGLFLLCALRNRWLWIIAIASLVIFLILTWFTSSRFLSYSDPVRSIIWKNAFLTFLEHPLAGIGYRQLEEQSDVLAQLHRMEPLHMEGWNFQFFKGHAHNNFLEAFAGTGVTGGLLFLGFCFAWVRECILSRTSQIFFLPGVVAFIVSGLFESTFIDSETVNVILLLYLASQMTLRLQRQNATGAAPAEAGDGT